MKKYLEFDKIEKIFYTNYFLEDISLNVKVPAEPLKNPDVDIKIEKFTIKNSVYLTDF
ncbi:MAG: hypothetical protein ACFFBP_09450 [Promethearchaeota archaeon]